MMCFQRIWKCWYCVKYIFIEYTVFIYSTNLLKKGSESFEYFKHVEKQNNWLFEIKDREWLWFDDWNGFEHTSRSISFMWMICESYGKLLEYYGLRPACGWGAGVSQTYVNQYRCIWMYMKCIHALEEICKCIKLIVV